MHDLSRALADLKRAAPTSFDVVAEAFTNLEKHAIRELQAAPPDAILKAQGKSGVLTQLREKFETCIKATK